MSDVDELPSWAPKNDQPAVPATTSSGSSGSGGRGLLFALLGLLLLAAVGIGGFLIASRGGDDDTTTAAAEAGDDTTAATDGAGTEADPTGDSAAPADATGTGAEAETEAEAEADGSTDTTELGPPVDISDGSVRSTRIEGGVFHLDGTVPNQEMMDQLVAVTEAAAGAENVQNNLTIDPSSPENTINYPVYIKDVVLFDFNSTEVKPEFLWLLQVGASFLTQNEQSTIEVVSYADSVGSAESNLRISEERAQAVKDIYVSLGAPADRVITVARGEEGASEDGSEEDAANDRRVEFYIGRAGEAPIVE